MVSVTVSALTSTALTAASICVSANVALPPEPTARTVAGELDGAVRAVDERASLDFLAEMVRHRSHSQTEGERKLAEFMAASMTKLGTGLVGNGGAPPVP